MPKHLDSELAGLERRLLVQAAAVEAAIHTAVRSLRERNSDLARQVIAGVPEIGRNELLMEDECLKILALHQPVAADLRRIIAGLKINTNLGRMDDLAVNIAERVLALAALPRVAVPEKLSGMTELTTGMVRQSLDSFVKQDPRLAREVIRLDDEVDRYNREIIDEMIRLMQVAGESVPAGISLFSAVRHLERIADHAAHVAEDVVYLVEGEVVRHRPDVLRAESQLHLACPQRDVKLIVKGRLHP